MNTIRSVCVYCGSSAGRDPRYLESGRRLGEAIGAAGMRLVYGGGTRGIMGAVAEGVIARGGAVTGIIPRFLIDMEATESELTRLDELIVTEDMHARKHQMFERSDAFVALPGGIGTLEELIEILTWSQLGRHAKPVIVANVGGFWDPLSRLMDHMSAEGFLHTAHQVRPMVIDDVDAIVPELVTALAGDDAHRRGRAEIVEKL
ncbi:TIGR00730 family Rossman fold protein [Aurantimonas coralicida]|uniref:LOG family protein n=1 Tax=Aurantimonas coralicida TaxID=182270 RepID=UPI001E32DEB8|nr:TIGR00730 family Rossman fold protein [Aurantimonas coralicida]MCD1643140.1 TIGR00730 family Rossman fold protein [Aurantimonas coralicida]